MVVWWKRVFTGDAAIDVTKIPDRAASSASSAEVTPQLGDEFHVLRDACNGLNGNFALSIGFVSDSVAPLAGMGGGAPAIQGKGAKPRAHRAVDFGGTTTHWGWLSRKFRTLSLIGSAGKLHFFDFPKILKVVGRLVRAGTYSAAPLVSFAQLRL